MKKMIIFCMAAVLFLSCNVETEEKENYSNEMKIAHTVDLPEDDGADSVEREGDRKESSYFKHPDFYHMRSTGTLTLLPRFGTVRQTSEWSHDVDAILMVLQYYGKSGKHNEETLTQFRVNRLKGEATPLQFTIQIFEGVGGFQIHSTYDYRESSYDKISLCMVQGFLEKDIPVTAVWNDWGGHWQIAIGYGTMGTETTQDGVFTVVDSYDAADHNQDGHGICPAEHFYYNWTMYDFFSKSYGTAERNRLSIAAESKA